jgi:transcriptional regulator with XRE-family HTH domain
MSADMMTPPATLRERVAGEIRAEMARRRLSGRELARRTGKSAPYWSRRMTGEVAFDLDDLEEVAGLLDVPVSRLLAVGGSLGQPIAGYVGMPGQRVWDLAA